MYSSERTDREASSAQLPPRIHNAYLFQAFNAVSWQLCLGSPLILFARELGAPAVVLGLLAGLAPLTSVLQLLVAPSAERIGYRNLMVKGWSARVATLLLLAVLPLAVGWLAPEMVLVLLIAVMLVFTSMRGIATCAWLPWLTAIVPRSVRGFYLSRDRIFIGVASVAALAISGAFVFNHTTIRAYSVIFGLSFLGGAASLYFLNRIPEPAATPKTVLAFPTEKWVELLRDAPFVRLLIFGGAVQVCVLSTATFVTVFVRDQVQLQDGAILWLSAGAALLGIGALTLLRNRIDRLGSRPLFGIVFLWWMLYFGMWFLLAAGWLGGAVLIAPLLLLANGFFGSTYELAMTRLTMNTVGAHPITTRYFALQSVFVSLLAGVAPILWGLLLDSLRGVHITVGGVELDNFALFFGLQWLTLGLVLITQRYLSDSPSTSTTALLYRVLVGKPIHGIALLMGRHQ